MGKKICRLARYRGKDPKDEVIPQTPIGPKTLIQNHGTMIYRSATRSTLNSKTQLDASLSKPSTRDRQEGDSDDDGDGCEE